MVANISPVKGVDVFLNTLKIVSTSFHDVVFVVIGPVYKSQKKYFETLKKNIDPKIEKSIVFLGAQKDVRPFLKFFDIYVCTSRFESSPISVWEAMSMGKPIVSTDVGDVPLYVENNKNGYIVPVGDYQLLADRIMHLLDNPEKISKFGVYSRKVAVDKLDISICSKKHIDAYNINF